MFRSHILVFVLSVFVSGSSFSQSSMITNPLLRAVVYGDVDQVQKSLDEGADIESQDDNGMTALHLAALWGNVEIFELLLRSGANIYAEDKSGSIHPLGRQAHTPLTLALMYSHEEIVVLAEEVLDLVWIYIGDESLQCRISSGISLVEARSDLWREDVRRIAASAKSINPNLENAGLPAACDLPDGKVNAFLIPKSDVSNAVNFGYRVLSEDQKEFFYYGVQ